jgi:signal transduction histidine kinase
VVSARPPEIDRLKELISDNPRQQARIENLEVRLIEQAGHKLHVSSPEYPVRLIADPNRLAQVIANLLSNAAKYTPAGGSIWLSSEQIGNEAIIRV